jgi:hypothetical protein
MDYKTLSSHDIKLTITKRFPPGNPGIQFVVGLPAGTLLGFLQGTYNGNQELILVNLSVPAHRSKAPLQSM